MSRRIHVASFPGFLDLLSFFVWTMLVVSIGLRVVLANPPRKRVADGCGLSASADVRRNPG